MESIGKCGAIWISFVRVVVTLDHYARVGAGESAQLALDLGYENAGGYARLLPEVEELQSLALAQSLLKDVLYGRQRGRD